MDFVPYLRAVREKAPLVQCITNFVTVNDCANILLAAGGSPTMAHDLRESAEAVESCAALVLNMGAIEDGPSMLSAGKRANALGIPVVLDPVAAGGTALRRTVAGQLLSELKLTAIRGNASEIKALALGRNGGSGVDVSAVDAVTEETLPQAVEMALGLSARTGAAVAVSGAIDVVAFGGRAAVLRNGCPTMAKITGSGCMVTALAGAFCGATPEDPFGAVCAAMAVMGAAGELADLRRLQNHTGNATFRNNLIDAIFNLTEEELTGRALCEEYDP